MKTLSLLIALLATVSFAHADFGPEDHDGVKRTSSNISQQHLSKRPYVAPVNKQENFEGAVETKSEVKKSNNLNLHMLGRKPYASQD
jgi:hypothetical protein